MSQDWLIRGRQPVSFDHLVAAVAAVSPESLLRVDSSHEWVVITDQKDRAVIWIGLSQSIADPVAESARLQLPPTSAENVWWTELVRPLWTPADVAATAADIAAALAEECEAEMSEWTLQHRGSAPVLDQQSEIIGDTPADQVTPAIALLFSTRPVTTDSAWLREFMRWAHEADRQPVLVTRHGEAELTPAAVDAVRRLGGLWAVDAGDGLFDGDSGRTLTVAHTGRLVLTDSRDSAADTFRARSVMAQQTIASKGHPYGNLSIGDFAERVIAAMSGYAGQEEQSAAGARISVVEPLGSPYDVSVVTELGAAASPDSTRFLIASPAGVGMVLCVPQPPAVVEQIVLSHPVREGQETMGQADIRRWAQHLHEAGATRASLAEARVTSEGNVIPGQGEARPQAVTFAEARFPGLDVWQLLQFGGVDVNDGTVTVIFPEDDETASGASLALSVLLDRHDELSAPEGDSGV